MGVEKIVASLVNEEIITKDEEEIVQFGLDSLKGNALSFILILITGALFDQITESILIWLLLFPLRKTVGGFHASSKTKCLLLTIGIFLMVFTLYNIFTWSLGALTVNCFVNGGIIWIFAPVDNPAKKLDSVAKKIYKKVSKIILCMEGLLLFWSAYQNWPKVIKSVSMSLTIMGISVLMGIIAYKGKTSDVNIMHD